MKKISKQDAIGIAGVALIAQRVSDMGHVWHERKTDAGIDGEIELRDRTTGEVRNHVLAVQSKARNLPFPGEDRDSFHFTVEERDLEYWLEGNLTVLLVCSHPADREAWWVNLNEYFSDASRRESRIVHFDKSAQRFDETAAQALAKAAAPAGSGLYLGPEPRRERLLSNLLPVRHPPTVHWVPCETSDVRVLGPDMREHNVYRGNWVLHNGHLYSFQPFAERAWNKWLAGPSMTEPTRSYLTALDVEEQRLATQLLRRTLADSFHRELYWHRQNHFFYFRPTDDLSPRKAPGRRTRERTVFKAYPKKTEPSETAYYRHDALHIGWTSDETGWYAQLNPSYHFTIDGAVDYPWAADQLAGMKRRERSAAVEGSLLMWAGFLRGDKPRLGDEERRLCFGDLVEFESEHGIDDSHWTGRQNDSDELELGTTNQEAIDLTWDDDGDEQEGLW